MRITEHKDLMERYEQPLGDACLMREGQVFYSENAARPDDFCESAWLSVQPFVLTLACGGRGIFGNWMKDECSAMVSCNDGFRPVSFLVEALCDESRNAETPEGRS